VFLGVTITGAGASRQILAPGILIIAGAAVLLSLAPKALFLAWFAAAPLLQESASLSPAGHHLALALYFAPSLVFVIWTLTRRPEWIHPRFLDVLPLGYFAYVVASLVLSGEASAMTVKGLYLILGIGIALYYFFAIGPIGALTPTNIVAVFLILTIGEGVMSVIDGLTNWNLWHDTGWQQPGGSRAVATLNNPAVLGAFLGMGIAFAAAVLVWDAPARLRRLAVVTLICGIPGLYFTLTRGPVVGTLAAVLVILMTQTRTRLIAAALAIVATVALTASWSSITTSTVYRNRVSNSGNVDVRLSLEKWSLKLAEKKPVFGWGYNAFNEAKQTAGFTAQDLQVNGTSSTSHNSYLTILVNYGAFGLLLFAIPWIVIPWRAIKSRPSQSESPWFMFGALAALFVFAVANNTGDFKYWSFVPAVPWILLGLLRRRQLVEV